MLYDGDYLYSDEQDYYTSVKAVYCYQHNVILQYLCFQSFIIFSSIPCRFVFANAPVDIRNGISMVLLYQFAATYAMRRPVALNVRLSRQQPKDVLELSDLCSKHESLDLYLWLSFRFPEYFVEQESCLEQKAFAISAIESSLDRPELRHRFSHSEAYSKMRSEMLAEKPDGLPPMTYGSSIRTSTAENLKKIPHGKLHVYPRLHEEEGDISTSIRGKPYIKGGSNFNYKGKNPNNGSSNNFVNPNYKGKNPNNDSSSNGNGYKVSNNTNAIRDNSNFLKNSNFGKKPSVIKKDNNIISEKKPSDNSNFLKNSNFVKRTSELKGNTPVIQSEIKKQWNRGNT
jgi:hypothetical protein